MSEKSQITLSGVPEGFDAQAVLNELGKNGTPVLHIARDDKRMVAMQAALRFFAPDVPVVVFPGWDCLPYDRASPALSIARIPCPHGLCPEPDGDRAGRLRDPRRHHRHFPTR